MPKQNLETKVEYNIPYSHSNNHFTGRNYVTAVYDNPSNIPLWDSTNFLMARWIITKPSDLKQTLANWYKERPSLVARLEEEGGSTVFDFDRKYTVDIGEKKPDGRPQKRRRKFTELTPQQLYRAARVKIKQEFESFNPMDLSYVGFFFMNDKKHPNRLPHVSENTLTANIKPKMGGVKETRFHKVDIQGPYEDSEIPFGLLSCDCNDSRFDKTKGGDTPYQMGCIDVAMVLSLARYQPKDLKDQMFFKELKFFKDLKAIREDRNTNVRLPFHFHEPQSYPIETRYSINGKQPNLRTLMVDSMFAYIFNKQSKYEIGKALNKIPVIYDPYLLRKLEEGNAGFEVVPNKFIFVKRYSVDRNLREWYKQMHFYYKKNGFELKRLVVENKDSEYESIAMEYQKGNEVRRLIFGDHPPIERKMIFDEKSEHDIFFIEKQEKQPEYKNPYSQLFKPHYGRRIKLEDFDDASRRMPIFSEYRIPWFGDVPEIMFGDYHKVIEACFEGGNKKFIENLHKRNEFIEKSDFNQEKVDNMSLFYKISKAA